MKSSNKLPGEERRAAIIRAVRNVFAEKGFDGTTTRELAQAAGVSEALLFKHFPNKESLYSAMQLACCHQEDSERTRRLRSLEPSTSTLVLLIHTMVSKMVGERMPDGDEVVMNRLMLRSLMEDGEFARLHLERLGSSWIPKLEECVAAAVAGDDAVADQVSPRLRAWFCRHLAAVLMSHLLPQTPVVDYGVSRNELIGQAVWFMLRGMGLREEAIRRHYNPQALALLAG